MIQMYLRLIKIGEKTIDDVPPKWRAQVQELLNQSEVVPEETEAVSVGD